jgi:hypothetical protein
MAVIPIAHQVARPMSKPVVQTAVTPHPVDLRPAGNTVALTAPSDNPFDQNRPITVKTQASGGGSVAPNGSRSLMTKHIPGVGESPNAVNQGVPFALGEEEEEGPTWVTAVQAITGAASQVLTSSDQAKIEAARARAEAARAEAAGEEARAAEARARANALMPSYNTAVRGTSYGLWAVGLGLLGVVGYFMYQNSKKKGVGLTGRKRRSRSRRR